MEVEEVGMEVGMEVVEVEVKEVCLWVIRFFSKTTGRCMLSSRPYTDPFLSISPWLQPLTL